MGGVRAPIPVCPLALAVNLVRPILVSLLLYMATADC